MALEESRRPFSRAVLYESSYSGMPVSPPLWRSTHSSLLAVMRLGLRTWRRFGASIGERTAAVRGLVVASDCERAHHPARRARGVGRVRRSGRMRPTRGASCSGTPATRRVRTFAVRLSVSCPSFTSPTASCATCLSWTSFGSANSSYGQTLPPASARLGERAQAVAAAAHQLIVIYSRLSSVKCPLPSGAHMSRHGLWSHSCGRSVSARRALRAYGSAHPRPWGLGCADGACMPVCGRGLLGA